jgi:hypothetical protein
MRGVLAMKLARVLGLLICPLVTAVAVSGRSSRFCRGESGPKWRRGGNVNLWPFRNRADAAVPKRTTVDIAERYDADAVYEVLKKDIELHRAPLVCMDRARQHDHPKVRALLDEHGILVLHGPPHYPQYYGQLER